MEKGREFEEKVKSHGLSSCMQAVTIAAGDDDHCVPCVLFRASKRKLYTFEVILLASPVFMLFSSKLLIQSKATCSILLETFKL